MSSVRLVVVIALAAAGCTGEIGLSGSAAGPTSEPRLADANSPWGAGPASGAGSQTGDQAGGGSGVVGNDAPIPEDVPNVVADCSPQALPPVHRLSETEYLNTLRALFPEYPGELDFTSDAALASFDNEAAALHANSLLVGAMSTNADAIAAWAVEDLDALVGCSPRGGVAENACARTFIADFGLRALRQPLAEEIIDSYMELFVEYRDAIDFEAGIQLTLSAMLQAPELMYRITPRVLDDVARPDHAVSFAAATRLSYALWQAPPDDQLLAAAAADGLANTDGVRRQLGGMVGRSSERMDEALRSFHRQWLDVDRILDPTWNAKDTDMFPEWTDEMVSSVHQESLDFIDEVMVTRQGGLRDLFTSQVARVDENTARLYEVRAGADGLVDLPQDRAGIFGRAAFLASHGHLRNGSPPLRGIAIMERAFCMNAGSPPPTADTTNPADELDASDFTNRELFERRAENEPCNSCHRIINSFAYPLEAFDAIGRFRTEDNDKPVDTTTDLMGTDIDGFYPDWPATASAFADSEMVQRCTSEHWLAFSFGRQVAKEEECLVDDLAQGMAAGDSFLDIMTRSALQAAVAEVE